MKFTAIAFVGLVASANALPNIQRRGAQFAQGEPISADGKGGPILGGTNKQIDVQNPDNLGQQSTDAGVVPNLKWSFSDSHTRILNGGWAREQVITDLPASTDISAAQQHLKKGATRELHWHAVAEWGIVYAGSVIVSAVDENGKEQVETLNYGDIWYFPKGVAHTIHGLEDENEYLLVFDDANFDKVGQTFNIDDWLTHTPKDILAKNFGVDVSVFNKLPSPNPYIKNGTVSNSTVTPGPAGVLSGDESFVWRTLQHAPEQIGGSGGTFYKIDSTNFKASKTLAATFVTLKPGGLRELHWHPTAQEWLYFHQGNAKATVFIGNSNSRTIDFSAGDTAVFPDNSGHYIENTGTEDLIWIEVYKADRVADISLQQWLALTPADIVANVLSVPIDFVESLKKTKQVLIA